MNRNEAIEIVKKNWPNNGFTQFREALETLIPELRVNEDERIRTRLIALVEAFGQGKYKKEMLAYLESQKPMYNLEIPAGDVAPAEEDGPFDEDEFLEDELSAFLQNYDKEYDDDAAVSDVAKHFYELGKKVKQQPAEWSEEDKSFYNSIMCEVIKEDMHPTPEQTKWLKSFLERFNLQLKKKWSKEDEKYLNLAINIVASDFGEDSPIVSRLKSLRSQPIQDKFDEAMYVADKYEEGYKAGVYDTKAKSWKPREEQIWALEVALENSCNQNDRAALESLKTDLQKLL